MINEKPISLEEAQKQQKLEQFAKEHPSEGDQDIFDQLFSAMTKTILGDDETSDEGSSEDYNETQTHPNI